MNPKLIINLFKLRTNLDRLVDRCHAVGIKTAIVTKVFCADERICRMISESEADAFADSRVQNLSAIAELHSDKPTQLLRISMQSEVEDVVRYADISMQSEKETIRLIGGAAKKLGKVHKIILMVDMGDLREGISTRMKRRFSPQRKQFLPNLHLNSTESVLTLPATVASFPMKQISADCLQLQTSCAKGILSPFPSSRAVIPQCSQCWRKIVSPKALPNFVSAKVSSSATIPKAVSPSNG